MHAKRKLKSPFVVTAASIASASMIACTGGAAEHNGDLTGAFTGQDPVTSNPPAPSGKTEVAPNVAPPTEPHVTVSSLPDCPAEAPAAGGACTPSQSCQYDTTGCTVIMACDQATSRWRDQSPTCNPPPPPICPASMPTIGTPCAGDLFCSYEPKDSPCPSPQAVCDTHTNTWQHVAVSCNPPPPPPPACPAKLPNGGSPCDATLACEYPNGTGCPGPTAVCDQGTGMWLIAITSCNPPAPPLPER